MKLASLKRGGRDGTLVVVSKDLARYVIAADVAASLQQVLENWEPMHLPLQTLSSQLDEGTLKGEALNITELAAPLPRAYQWLDGSAYLTHVERVRNARGAEMPPSFLEDPLMYQGGSDSFLGPRDEIVAENEEWGIDFESEVAVVVDDVLMGIGVEEAEPHIKLLMLVNDVSLRNLIPGELAKGFGFLHGKPPTAFSPVAVTPDELGNAWRGSKVNHPLETRLNGQLVGRPNAGADMQFDFSRLVSHAAKTRPLSAGTIIGSGTVSNADVTAGISCLAERRVLEIIESGNATTPFLHYGDRVQIDMYDESGQSIFGSIDQVVGPWRR